MCTLLQLGSGTVVRSVVPACEGHALLSAPSVRYRGSPAWLPLK